MLDELLAPLGPMAKFTQQAGAAAQAALERGSMASGSGAGAASSSGGGPFTSAFGNVGPAAGGGAPYPQAASGGAARAGSIVPGRSTASFRLQQSDRVHSAPLPGAVGLPEPRAFKRQRSQSNLHPASANGPENAAPAPAAAAAPAPAAAAQQAVLSVAARQQGRGGGGIGKGGSKQRSTPVFNDSD